MTSGSRRKSVAFIVLGASLTAGVGKRRPYKNLFHLLGCYLLSLLLASCSTPPPPLRPTDPEIAAAAKRGHRAFHGGRRLRRRFRGDRRRRGWTARPQFADKGADAREHEKRQRDGKAG